MLVDAHVSPVPFLFNSLPAVALAGVVTWIFDARQSCIGR